MSPKYRQRGYMDSDRDREKPEKKPVNRREQFGPKTPNMPGKREVSRCASCALILPVGIDLEGRCPKCGFELHSCKQCAFFDTAARFECTRPITTRIPRKDIRTSAAIFRCERQSSVKPPPPSLWTRAKPSRTFSRNKQVQHSPLFCRDGVGHPETTKTISQFHLLVGGQLAVPFGRSRGGRASRTPTGLLRGEKTDKMSVSPLLSICYTFPFDPC